MSETEIPNTISRTGFRKEPGLCNYGPYITGLKPLSIGPVRLAFPAIQAPLSGYSDRPQRYISRNLNRIIGSLGGCTGYDPELFRAAGTVAEVMLDQFIITVKRGVRVNRCLGLDEFDHPCGAQIMGADPLDFPPAARRLAESGFDWIDLNFACPVRKVLGRQRGGFLMSDPETALEMTARTRDALPPEIPLTIKVRKGFDDTRKSTDDFYRIFNGAFEIGVDAVAIHGRTVVQGYTGDSDWDFIHRVKQEFPNRKILGSGDLFSAQTCIDRIRQTGIDGVVIARGAIGNPWIFPSFNAMCLGLPAVPEPALELQGAVLQEHFRRTMDMYGEKRACALMRKFGIKMSETHPQAEDVRLRFAVVKSARDWAEVLEQYYGVPQSVEIS